MTNRITTERIAFWLLPAEDDYALLADIINQLSARFGSPAFKPHLTLATCPARAVAEPQSLLEQLAGHLPAFTLSGTGIPTWSSQFNQALVQHFAVTPELTACIEKLHPQGIVPNGYRPHISLLYADLDATTGQQLAREWAVDGLAISFDRIAAIAIGPQTVCAADVEVWKTIATVPLRQKER